MLSDEKYERPTSSEYLFVLPPLACVAFAVRCARRLQPLLVAEEHAEAATVDELLDKLDGVCRGWFCFDDEMEELYHSFDYIDDKEDFPTPAETAIVVARWAAAATKFPDSAAGATHFAAMHVYLSSPENAQAAWDDFRRLRDAVTRGEIADDSGIEPEFFGPL